MHPSMQVPFSFTHTELYRNVKNALLVCIVLYIYMLFAGYVAFFKLLLQLLCVLSLLTYGCKLFVFMRACCTYVFEK